SEYINSFKICASTKTPKSYTRQPITPLEVSRPFQMIAWDIMGPLQVSKGYISLHMNLNYFYWIKNNATKK
ncbi:hypothetical protein BpHYR1_052426, partial [Brachionus plicatilis]